MTDTITNDFSWLKNHIILLVIVVFLVIGLVYSIDSIIARHDAANSAQANVVLQQQTAQTNLLAAKLQQDETVSAQQTAQLLAMNAQLTSYITQRDKAIIPVLQKDTTLSAVDAAQKIAVQTKATSGEVIPQNDTVIVDLPVARNIVASLDQLPVTQADLSDTQKQLSSEIAIASNLQNNVTDGQKLIDSMRTQATDADKSCKAEIAVVKVQARKSKIKWFFAGVVAGLLGGRYI